MQNSTATLTSLPNELLIRILAHLADNELYNLILVSRSVHTCATHILFQRNFPGLLQYGNFDLNTGYSPRFLLPAIHGALDVVNLSSIRITFDSPGISRFFEEVRLITAVVERIPEVPKFTVDFTGQAKRFGGANTLEMVEALQRMFNAVLMKGCTSLSVQEGTGNWGPLRVGLKQKRTSLGLSTLLRPFGGLFSAKRPSWKVMKSVKRPVKECGYSQHEQLLKKKLGEKKDLSVKEQLDGMSNSREGPEIVPISSICSIDRTDKVLSHGFISFGTEMFFYPPWLDWTLSLFNHTGLCYLSIEAQLFSKDFWAEVLPQVHIPALLVFSFKGDKITTNDLGHFLQRHAQTLKNLSLEIPRPAVQARPAADRTPQGDDLRCASDSGASDFSGSSKPDSSAFHFPNIDGLTLTPYCVEWFFQNVMAAPLHKPHKLDATTPEQPLCRRLLPCLNTLTITSTYCTEPDAFFAQLDSALDIVAQFLRTSSEFQVKNSDDKTSTALDWFCSLTIDTQALGTVSHASWFTSHSSRDTSSPLSAFNTMSYINLFSSYWSTPDHTTKAEFSALPGFLALFSGLKVVFCTSSSVKVVKGFDEEYWKEMRRLCPRLQEICLSTAYASWVVLDEEGKAKVISRLTGKDEPL